MGSAIKITLIAVLRCGSDGVLDRSKPPTPVLRSFSRFLYVAHKRLALMNRYIRIADQRCELVDNVARYQTFVPPVKRHAYMVNRLFVNLQRAQSTRHERLGPHLSA